MCHYVKEAGVSVLSIDASQAWLHALHLAQQLRVSISVTFVRRGRKPIPTMFDRPEKRKLPSVDAPESLSWQPPAEPEADDGDQDVKI